MSNGKKEFLLSLAKAAVTGIAVALALFAIRRAGWL